MTENKLFIDRLELAYERSTSFENELLVYQDQVEYDPTHGWENDVSCERKFIDPTWLEALLEGNYEPDITGTSIENTVTYRNWRFIRGSFPGPNTPYKYNYRVEYSAHGEWLFLGYIYYQTYLLRRDHLYLRLANYALYNEDYWRLVRLFEDDLGLRFVHVSKVDIALDSMVDTSKLIYNLMRRDKSIEWIINGHRIQDRNASIKKLFWATSGSLNNPDINRSLYVTQTEGLTINCYDKTAEVTDKSNKYYQIGDWNYDEDGTAEGDNIYRNETRLSRKNIINYITGHHINDNEFRNLLQNPESRFDIFRDTCRKLIRWNKDGRSQDITSLVTTDNSKKTTTYR